MGDYSIIGVTVFMLLFFVAVFYLTRRYFGNANPLRQAVRQEQLLKEILEETRETNRLLRKSAAHEKDGGE